MRYRQLIRRQRAASHIFNLMVSFAATVLVTRIFLELTGYPQIGNSQLHIAHVLWGGLILAAGALLPLLYGTSWIYGVSATLSGIGLGLFIDEVGKFLTQDNNYFFRPAASLIYILFLLTLYLYSIVRREAKPSARERLHHALVALQEVVDGDLDVREKAELETLLTGIIGDAKVPDVRELALSLLGFIRQEADSIPEPRATLRRWWERTWGMFTERVLTRQTMRWGLIIGTALLGLASLVDLVALTQVLVGPATAEDLLAAWINRGELTATQEAIWFALMIALQVLVGALLTAGFVSFLLGQDRRGISLSLAGLLLSITTLNVLVFYFEQFVAATKVAVDLALIAGLNFYRSHRLPDK